MNFCNQASYRSVGFPLLLLALQVLSCCNHDLIELFHILRFGLLSNTSRGRKPKARTSMLAVFLCFNAPEIAGESTHSEMQQVPFSEIFHHHFTAGFLRWGYPTHESHCPPGIKHGNGQWTIYRWYSYKNIKNLHSYGIFQLPMFDCQRVDYLLKKKNKHHGDFRIRHAGRTLPSFFSDLMDLVLNSPVDAQHLVASSSLRWVEPPGRPRWDPWRTGCAAETLIRW